MGSDSTTSSNPPLSDSPLKKKLKEKFRRKSGGKMGHRGHRQQMLVPTKAVAVEPHGCACGHEAFGDLTSLHTHQVTELPEIRMELAAFAAAGSTKPTRPLSTRRVMVPGSPR